MAQLCFNPTFFSWVDHFFEKKVLITRIWTPVLWTIPIALTLEPDSSKEDYLQLVHLRCLKAKNKNFQPLWELCLETQASFLIRKSVDRVTRESFLRDTFYLEDTKSHSWFQVLAAPLSQKIEKMCEIWTRTLEMGVQYQVCHHPCWKERRTPINWIFQKTQEPPKTENGTNVSFFNFTPTFFIAWTVEIVWWSINFPLKTFLFKRGFKNAFLPFRNWK